MRPLCGWLPSVPPLNLYRTLYLPAPQAPGARIKAMISVAAMTARALLTEVQNKFLFMSLLLPHRVARCDSLQFGSPASRKSCRINLRRDLIHGARVIGATRICYPVDVSCGIRDQGGRRIRPVTPAEAENRIFCPSPVLVRRQFEHDTVSVRATGICRAIEIARRIEDHSANAVASILETIELVQHLVRPLVASAGRQLKEEAVSVGALVLRRAIQIALSIKDLAPHRRVHSPFPAAEQVDYFVCPSAARGRC